MAFSWSPADILAICVSEADIEVLTAAGFQAILEPPPEEFGPLPKAGHYIVVANGRGIDIAKDLVSSGVCHDWQISVNHLGGYQDLTHAADLGGVELVREIIRNSKSLYDDEAHPFTDVHKPENVPSYRTGWAFLEPYIRWTTPEFGVFCGPYAGGKSALAQMLACDWADVAGRAMSSIASICAWEDAGWRVKRNIERFAVSRENDDPRYGAARRIKDLLQTTWRITRRPGELRDIGWYLQRCELLVKRQNCRFFVFDPWNEHDEVRDRNDNETQYVNKMLRELREFTAVHNVIMIVVTHIAGKSYDEEGGIRPFRVAQAHGSSHFGKKCDRGLCVARTRTLSSSRGENRMIIRFDKAKDEESMGKIDDIAVKCDPYTMNMSLDLHCSDEIRKAWRG
jgi:hypothetical protein